MAVAGNAVLYRVAAGRERQAGAESRQNPLRQAETRQAE